MERNLVPTLSQEHKEIHEAMSFERHVDSANLPVAALNVAFKTLAGTKRAHMTFGFGMSDEVLIEVIEGATWDSESGTALDIFEHSRGGGASTLILENANQPTFTASNQVIKNVTTIAGGTTFESQYTYNAGSPATIDAETRYAVHEWILKADTTYVVRASKTDDNCKISIDLHWYEHTINDTFQPNVS